MWGFVCLQRALGSPNTPEPAPEDCEFLRQGLSGLEAAAVEIWYSTLEPDRRRRRLNEAMRGGRVEDYTTPPTGATDETSDPSNTN
ncbi:hypothetical protein [Candidatus Rariloculus sp.]|uniref:hypothetical protein n=1 Tax=Candidatus Rariloculus sp. TaxID=3101265 RepID=UPI003D10DBAA